MRPVLLLPAWLGLLLAACSPSTFTAEVKGETTLPAGPPGLSTLLNAFPAISSFTSLDFNDNQDFKNQGVTKDEVRSVKLQSLRLKILGPDDLDFGFLDSVEFFAKAGDQEVRIAHRESITRLGLRAPNPVLSVDVERVELLPYVTAPSMSLIVRGKGRMPEREVRLQALVAFDVTVELL